MQTGILRLRKSNIGIYELFNVIMVVCASILHSSKIGKFN